MIRPQDCEILQWRSFDDEAAFFASMGRFFASARVRRECGGYPLSDGPYHRWFVLRRQGDTRILGFVSLEQHPDVVRLRDAYLRAEARGRGCSAPCASGSSGMSTNSGWPVPPARPRPARAFSNRTASPCIPPGVAG
ncbi:hypothetical protein P4126_27660 [Pseudomonas aeruginosa]|nr:hypothetical protein [Pseudomonas aeruginosa]MDF5953440.1 hypothetical protein [Pseudomonas aeruginosa]